MINGAKEAKEKKAEALLFNVFNNIKYIEKSIYSFYSILINQSDNTKNNVSQIKIDNNNIPYKGKILIYWEILKSYLKNLNFCLEITEKKNYFIDSFEFYRNIYFNNSINKFWQLNILPTIKYKLLGHIYMPEIKIQLLKLLNHITIELRQPKDIFEYINYSNLKQKSQKKGNEPLIQKFPYDMALNIQEAIAGMTIELFTFNIFIKLPYKNILEIFDFPDKIIAIVKFKYEHPISPLKIKDKNNKLDIKNNLENQNQKRNFLLTEKLSKLFTFRIYSFIKKLFEEKIKYEGRDILAKIYNNFLHYIYDYDKLFNIKCGLCNKIVKYSLQEKCFYPPYYKIYDEIEINQKLKTKGEKTLFYHEECFKKIVLSI